jgi:hypothetical protein
VEANNLNNEDNGEVSNSKEARAFEGQAVPIPRRCKDLESAYIIQLKPQIKH